MKALVIVMLGGFLIGSAEAADAPTILCPYKAPSCEAKHVTAPNKMPAYLLVLRGWGTVADTDDKGITTVGQGWVYQAETYLTEADVLKRLTEANLAPQYVVGLWKLGVPLKVAAPSGKWTVAP